MMLRPRFKPRKITTSMDVLYIDTDHGPIKVWADKNGIYIDLIDNEYGDVCLSSFHPEEYGFSSSVYENYGSAFPTKTGFFREIQNAYGCMLNEDPVYGSKKVRV